MYAVYFVSLLETLALSYVVQTFWRLQAADNKLNSDDGDDETNGDRRNKTGDFKDSSAEDVCPGSRWGDWSPCTVTCGGGLRVRHRAVFQRTDNCTHSNVQVEACATEPCSGRNSFYTSNKDDADGDQADSNDHSGADDTTRDGQINPQPSDHTAGGADQAEDDHDGKGMNDDFDDDDGNEYVGGFWSSMRRHRQHTWKRNRGKDHRSHEGPDGGKETGKNTHSHGDDTQTDARAGNAHDNNQGNVKDDTHDNNHDNAQDNTKDNTQDNTQDIHEDDDNSKGEQQFSYDSFSNPDDFSFSDIGENEADSFDEGERGKGQEEQAKGGQRTFRQRVYSQGSSDGEPRGRNWGDSDDDLKHEKTSKRGDRYKSQGNKNSYKQQHKEKSGDKNKDSRNRENDFEKDGDKFRRNEETKDGNNEGGRNTAKEKNKKGQEGDERRENRRGSVHDDYKDEDASDYENSQSHRGKGGQKRYEEKRRGSKHENREDESKDGNGDKNKNNEQKSRSDKQEDKKKENRDDNDDDNNDNDDGDEYEQEEEWEQEDLDEQEQEDDDDGAKRKRRKKKKKKKKKEKEENHSAEDDIEQETGHLSESQTIISDSTVINS